MRRSSASPELKLTTDEDNPQAPSRPPWHSTPHRLTFRPVTLKPRSEEADTAATKKPRKHRAAAILSADPAADPNTGMASQPDNIAGPSGTRDSVEPGSVFLSAQPVHAKKPPKIPIDTLEQLLAIQPEMVPSQTRCKLHVSCCPGDMGESGDAEEAKDAKRVRDVGDVGTVGDGENRSRKTGRTQQTNDVKVMCKS